MKRYGNGTVLALDELKLADGKLVASVLFQLTSGTSKSRSNLKQTLQDRLQWVTFVLSSGEQSLKEKVISDKGKWLPGMSVRFSDIDVTDINSHVDKKTIDDILTGIQNNYGNAGPAFCKALVKSGLNLKPDDLVSRIHKVAQNLAGSGADGTLERAAMPLALIQTAGELAQEFRVLPRYDIASAVQWAWSRYLASADAASLDPAQDCINALADYCASNWNVSIRSLSLFGDEKSFREAVAWYDDQCIYFRADRVVDAVGIGLKRAEIARILDDGGYLGKTDNDRKTCRRVPGMGGVTVYALHRGKIGPEPPEAVPSLPTGL